MPTPPLLGAGNADVSVNAVQGNASPLELHLLNRHQGENYIQLNPESASAIGSVSLRNLKEQNPSSHQRKPVSRKVDSTMFPGFRRSPE